MVRWLRRAAVGALGALGLAALTWSSGPALASDLGRYDATRVCTIRDSRLDEISGMALSARHPGTLWVHNDSDGGPYVYAVDATTCEVQARITVSGAKARDFEAMAVGRDRHGRPVLWLADIGDNLDSWPYVELLRIREPAQIRDAVLPAARYRVTYEDGPHNAETLLADPISGRMWLVTKKLASGRLYELPRHLSTRRTNTATFVREERGLITDGAVSPDGTRYVLRDYVDATVFDGLPPGRDPQIVQMPFEPQGEAIAWTADGQSLLILSERDTRLLQVPVPVDAASPRVQESGSSTAEAPTTSPPARPSPPASAQPSAPASLAARSSALPVGMALGLVALAAAAIGVVEWRRRRGGGRN